MYFEQIWRGVCAERQELALFVHFQANLEGSLCGKTRTGSVCAFSDKYGAEFVRKEKTGGIARELEWEGSKRRNIAELVGYKDSGGEMVRKVEFETVQGSAPTTCLRAVIP